MAQTLLCLEPPSSQHSEVQGWKACDPMFSPSSFLPSLAPLKFVSLNKVRMQVSFSLWFLWTINTTCFASNISKYKPAILRSWSLKTFFFKFNLKLFHRGSSPWFFLHALVQVLDEDDELPELELPSSCHLSRLLLLAFMKKLLTVLSSKPSCWEMVICNSLDGRLFSLNIACRVRRWTSVKTSLGFLGVLPLSFPCSCSFLLQAAKRYGRRFRTNSLPGIGQPFLTAFFPSANSRLKHQEWPGGRAIETQRAEVLGGRCAPWWGLPLTSFCTLS